MKRRLLFLLGLLALYLLVFHVIPQAKRLPWVGEAMIRNETSGIHVSGLFYTEVEQVSQFAATIHLKPKSD